MIIKRKYACYYQLLEDQISKKAMLDAFTRHGYDEEKALELLQLNGGVIVHNTDMGSCIPYEIYHDLLDALAELDAENPFDNQLTYNDVSGVETYTSRRGNAMTQVLYCRFFDFPIRIVQVIAFGRDGSGIKPIEPWDLDQIILN